MSIHLFKKIKKDKKIENKNINKSIKNCFKYYNFTYKFVENTLFLLYIVEI